MTRTVRSTLSSKGQITVPKLVRDRLKATQGTQLEFVLDDDNVTVRLASPSTEPLQAWFGIAPLPEGQTVSGWIREMREPEPESLASPAQPERRILFVRPGDPIRL